MFTKKIFRNRKFSEPKKSPIFAVIKVPGLNNLGKNNECRNAGNIVVESLNKIHSNGQGKIIDKKLLDTREIELDNANLEEQEKLIYENALNILNEQSKIMFLGGDHSISYSIGRAFLDFCNGKEPCLIVFDAHADCDYANKEPTHEEWLRALIEKGFPTDNVLLVGGRNIWESEKEFLNKNEIKRINMNELNDNLQKVTNIIMEFSNGKELYVSFDIDVIDPVYAPDTGYKESGGLTSGQALYILGRLSKLKNLRVFDLVEINCENKKNITIKLAAKLLAEMF